MALKDLLILAALIFMVSTLVQRVKKYIKIHKQSLIHELDTSFFDTIQTAQRIVGMTRQAVNVHTSGEINHPLARKMASLDRQLDDIEQKYTKNTPALALLGPIGTASIVLKEEQLKQKLIFTLCEIHDILATLLNKETLTREQRKTVTLNEIIDLDTMYAKEAQRLV